MEGTPGQVSPTLPSGVLQSGTISPGSPEPFTPRFSFRNSQIRRTLRFLTEATRIPLRRKSARGRLPSSCTRVRGALWEVTGRRRDAVSAEPPPVSAAPSLPPRAPLASPPCCPRSSGPAAAQGPHGPLVLVPCVPSGRLLPCHLTVCL